MSRLNLTLIFQSFKQIFSELLKCSLGTAMDYRKRLLATLSVLALGVGASADTTPSFAAPQSSIDNAGQCLPGATEEECECEQALRENTVEALQRFLQRYPPKPGGNSNACAALALAALVATNSDQNQKETDTPDPDRPDGGVPYPG